MVLIFAYFTFCIKISIILFVESTAYHETSYTKPGDIMIGGLFPLHYNAIRPDNYSLLREPAPTVCNDYNYLGFRWMQAMIFAIDQINNRSDLLPDLKLGYQLFDTCNNNGRAVSQAIYLVENILNSSNESISAVVGPTASDKSIITSNIFSIYDLPQISYASTSKILSNKDIYNSFLRTIPNDDEQVMAIVDLLIRYNWKWVGVIAGDNDYGRPATALLKEKAKASNICIEYTEYISKSTSKEKIQSTAKEIRDFNATVFVLFISASNLKKLASELSNLNITDKVWIASEAWATSDTISKANAKIFEGTLGIATRGGQMPGFRRFLEEVSPVTQANNPFLIEFWRQNFNCSCTTCYGYNASNSTLKPCAGNDDFSLSIPGISTYMNWEGTELAQSYNIYLAVYAIAHALNDIKKCLPGNRLLENNRCPTIKNLKPWQLLAYIKNVNFTQPAQNTTFYFDQNLDPQAAYKLVNWQNDYNDGKIVTRYVDVGYYSIFTNPKWLINQSIQFGQNKSMKVPPSLCTPDCPAGSYRIKLSSSCCYECKPCSISEYSTDVNSHRCIKCSRNETSNSTRTGCTPKYQEYVRWDDGFGITFCILVAVGVHLTVISAGAFYKYRGTPLVKATNVQLSFVLFGSLTCCFLTPLFYIAKPENWSCKARVVLFALSFTVCVAVILVKTLRVLTAFETKFPVKNSKKMKWLGENLQVLLVFFIAFLQVFLCIAWILVDPPLISDANLVNPEKIIVLCPNGNLALLFSIYGYICVLAIVAFVLAFRARKLPENFNEAKFITFAMLIFFIVWCSFIPAYLTTTGMITTVVYCIAILSSSYGLLACIFFPKLYIIILHPERNTKSEMRLNAAQHTLRQTKKLATKSKATCSNKENELSMDLDLIKGFSCNVNSNNNTRKSKKTSSSIEPPLRKKFLNPYISYAEYNDTEATSTSTLSVSGQNSDKEDTPKSTRKREIDDSNSNLQT